MSLFLPGDAPPVVLAYHAARSAWERLAYDPRMAGRDTFGGVEYARYCAADADLAEAIQGHGGSWLVSATTYRLSAKGIEILRDWPEEPDRDVQP